MSTALVTGISGQDGSYLAEFLADKGYRVVGTTRDAQRAVAGNLSAIHHRVELLEVGMGDSGAVAELVRRVQPDEIYNLAGQTQVEPSWQDPVATAEADAVSVARWLDALRRYAPGAAFFQATSADIFAPAHGPLNEHAPLEPSSPYGAAKLYAHSLAIAYRHTYRLRAVSGILFNHESPRRPETYVTRKITRAAARIARGLQHGLSLGKMDSRRDWGFAGDYVDAAWRMLQQDEPTDLVIGTGSAHSVEEFCDLAFRHVGLDYREYVTIDPAIVRTSDVPLRVAEPTQARMRLGWTPRVSFPELVRMMVDSDLNALDR
jgi:GDPmannose 4,6-dehydratase